MLQQSHYCQPSRDHRQLTLNAAISGAGISNPHSSETRACNTDQQPEAGTCLYVYKHFLPCLTTQGSQDCEAESEARGHPSFEQLCTNAYGAQPLRPTAPST
eukprot:1045628-Pelagomonas_calceolata.AAC.2